MIPSVTADLIYQTQVICGECPVWDVVEQRLYWADLTNCHVYIFDPRNGSNTVYYVGRTIGGLVLRESGGLLLAAADGFSSFDPLTGRIDPIQNPLDGSTGYLFNDGKCDPQGRFWAASYHQDLHHPIGSLYSLERDLTVRLRWGGLVLPNGLGWSPDMNKFYHVDSLAKAIFCFDYDPDSGDITNRSVITTFGDGVVLPDGLTVDTEGFLWVAVFNSGKVIRVDPASGDTVFEVIIPAARQVTSCTFGGRNLDELYVTTAKEVGGVYGIPEDEVSTETNAGGLFRAKLPFMGLEPVRFGA